MSAYGGKADIFPCPLFTQKRTFAIVIRMSAKGQIRTKCNAAKKALGRLQADNSTWAIKSTYVQLRPTVWAIEVVKRRRTATAAQRAACNAASEGVTLNYH
jgi:hypothetical protein